MKAHEKRKAELIRQNAEDLLTELHSWGSWDGLVEDFGHPNNDLISEILNDVRSEKVKITVKVKYES